MLIQFLSQLFIARHSVRNESGVTTASRISSLEGNVGDPELSPLRFVFFAFSLFSLSRSVCAGCQAEQRRHL